jgi:hypothetical protein
MPGRAKGDPIIIVLNPDLRLRWDDLCVSIDRRTVAKRGMSAGTEDWSPIGYYSTLSQACEFLLQRHVPDLTHENIQDLKSLQITIWEAVKMIKESV